jgi:uncharacterized UBP type Zn finger protein
MDDVQPSPKSVTTCAHLDTITEVTPSDDGCHECLQIGGHWVHLRMCQSCGDVGCCDSSPGQHATRHYHATAHPLIQSFEPGEEWLWSTRRNCSSSCVASDPRRHTPNHRRATVGAAVGQRTGVDQTDDLYPDLRR